MPISKHKLKEFGLYENESTMIAAAASGHTVYGIIGFDEVLVSTYDFNRNKPLPDNIWSISTVRGNWLFQLHIDSTMLMSNKESVKWAAKQLEIQIYLKSFYNEE